MNFIISLEKFCFHSFLLLENRNTQTKQKMCAVNPTSRKETSVKD